MVESVKCDICEGQKIVNTPWPSGYPHAFPCPKCCPVTPCACGCSNCPGPAQIVAWRVKRDEEEQLLRAESKLRETHEANEARKRGTVFGFETYASLSSVDVNALLKEIERLRSISAGKI